MLVEPPLGLMPDHIWKRKRMNPKYDAGTISKFYRWSLLMDMIEKWHRDNFLLMWRLR